MNDSVLRNCIALMRRLSPATVIVLMCFWNAFWYTYPNSYRSDPETAYYASGMRLEYGLKPTITEHPGVGTQLVSSGIRRLLKITPDCAYSEYSTYRSFAVWLAWLIVSSIILIVGWSALNFSISAYWLVIILVFSIPSFVNSISALTGEYVSVLLGGVLLSGIYYALFSCRKVTFWIWCCVVGVLCGFVVSSRINAIGLAVASCVTLYFVESVSLKAKLIGVALCFLVMAGTFVIMLVSFDAWKGFTWWISSVAGGSAQYGGGGRRESFIDLGMVLKNLFVFEKTILGFDYFYICFIWLFSVVLCAIWWRNRKSFGLGPKFGLLFLGCLSFVLTFCVYAMHPFSPRYLVPCLFPLIVGFCVGVCSVLGNRAQLLVLVVALCVGFYNVDNMRTQRVLSWVRYRTNCDFESQVFVSNPNVPVYYDWGVNSFGGNVHLMKMYYHGREGKGLPDLDLERVFGRPVGSHSSNRGLWQDESGRRFSVPCGAYLLVSDRKVSDTDLDSVVESKSTGYFVYRSRDSLFESEK